jgi:hypothetical protein
VDRYALRVTYQAPEDINRDGDICSLIRWGTLCCVKVNEKVNEKACDNPSAVSTRSLIFEYTEHHSAVDDMRYVAASLPNLLSVIVYPKGFACDNCCCLGQVSKELPEE